MEEEILQEMIRDRESQIAMIQKKLELQEKKLARKQELLDEVKQKYTETHAEEVMEIEQLNKRHSQLLGQYKEAEEGLDMKKQQQGPALHVYNEIMKSLTDPTESQDSSYVTRMQAQLCKAMHSMGMVETQLAMYNNQVDLLQKYLRESNTVMVEEKSQVELKLMNDLVLADNARKEIDQKVTEQNNAFVKEKDALVEKIEQQQDKEDEEAEEDDDEEEKEELMEILLEGREEIKRLEEENKEELDKLEELKQKIIAVKGEKFVEELIAHIEEEMKEKQGDNSE